MATNKEIWDSAAETYERYGFTAAAIAARTFTSDLRRFGNPELIIENLGKLPGIIDNHYPAYIRKKIIQKLADSISD